MGHSHNSFPHFYRSSNPEELRVDTGGEGGGSQQR